MEISRHTKRILACASFFSLMLLILFTFLVSGCASFRQSEKDIITEIVAQNVGYLISKETPKLATTILKYTEWTLETIENPDFDKWKDCIIGLLIDDEFLKMNFEKLILLIEIDLEGIGDVQKRTDVIIPILQSFAKGIKVGLR